MADKATAVGVLVDKAMRYQEVLSSIAWEGLTEEEWTKRREEARKDLEEVKKVVEDKLGILMQKGFKCYFCEARASSVEDAIDKGWSPDFWDASQKPEVFHPNPVCKDCGAVHLTCDESSGERLKK